MKFTNALGRSIFAGGMIASLANSTVAEKPEVGPAIVRVVDEPAKQKPVQGIKNLSKPQTYEPMSIIDNACLPYNDELWLKQQYKNFELFFKQNKEHNVDTMFNLEAAIKQIKSVNEKITELVNLNIINLHEAVELANDLGCRQIDILQQGQGLDKEEIWRLDGRHLTAALAILDSVSAQAKTLIAIQKITDAQAEDLSSDNLEHLKSTLNGLVEKLPGNTEKNKPMEIFIEPQQEEPARPIPIPPLRMRRGIREGQEGIIV